MGWSWNWNDEWLKNCSQFGLFELAEERQAVASTGWCEFSLPSKRVKPERSPRFPARFQVLMFLEQNHFRQARHLFAETTAVLEWKQKRLCQVNSQKGFLCITYPLHEAVKQKNVIMVKLLLMFGADPTMPLALLFFWRSCFEANFYFFRKCGSKFWREETLNLRKDHWGRTAYYYGRAEEEIVQVFERCLGRV